MTTALPHPYFSVTNNDSSLHFTEAVHVEKRVGVKKRGPPAPLIIDVKGSNQVVVPVELRSPRNENTTNQPYDRNRRNARVFVLPSSDDSGSDIIDKRIMKEQYTSPPDSSRYVPSYCA